MRSVRGRPARHWTEIYDDLSPSGGAVVDSERRVTIDDILNTLRQHGLIDARKNRSVSSGSAIRSELTEAFWQQLGGNDVLARHPALS
jgi:hypothetical protein